MNTIAAFIKQKRKEVGLRRRSLRSRLGCCCVCELEQGKETMHMDMDKANQALAILYSARRLCRGERTAMDEAYRTANERR